MTSMTRIGKPIRKKEYWPLEEPIPRKREQPEPATPEREPVKEPEKFPEKVGT